MCRAELCAEKRKDYAITAKYMFLLAKLILLYVSLSIESRSTCITHYRLTCRAFSDKRLDYDSRFLFQQFIQCYDKKYTAKISHNRCMCLVL